MTIRVGIMGYGNLGRGVECALKQNPDMELTAVFTRRDPGSVKILTEGVNVYPAKDAQDLADQVDVLILCGGSATDLPEQTPEYAKYFNVVDSFDTHAKIPEHFAAVDKAAREAGNTAVISAGWDPGMFSLNRLYGNAVLPDGKDYTFWGRGVSQGHSDPGGKRPGGHPQRGNAGADHKTEAHKRVLCGGRGRGRQGSHRKRDRDHAQLLCRL